MLKCIDIRQRLALEIPRKPEDPPEKYAAQLNGKVRTVVENLRRWAGEHGQNGSRMMLDIYSRPPYKRYQDSDTPLNRVLIRTGGNRLGDLAEHSSIIAAAQPFEINRAYVFRDDSEAENVVENEMRTLINTRKSTRKARQ